VDKKSALTALAIHPSGEKLAVSLINGSKRVFSLPKFGRLAQAKEVHELPAPALEFVGDATVSGSGDRVVHILPGSGGGGGGGGGTIMYVVFILLVLLVIANLTLRIGVQGAKLSQGQ